MIWIIKSLLKKSLNFEALISESSKEINELTNKNNRKDRK